MAVSGLALCVHAFALSACACAAHFAAPLLDMSEAACAGVLTMVWFILTLQVVGAHGHRVLIRTMLSDSARLAEGGGIVVAFPEYVVRERRQFGPWSSRDRLPLPHQVLDVDVPAMHIPVDNGLYCLRVNTKVVGVVQSYTVKDLTANPIPIESRINDVIANALRSAVYDKPLEEALIEIQRIFLQDAAGISKLISTPAFQVSQLLLDADDHISPANAATKQALEILVERKQEAAKRSVLEASMDTEEQKVKLRKIALESERSYYMLQQEVFGKEGAAIVEASKHAKVLYLCTGSSAGPVFAAPIERSLAVRPAGVWRTTLSCEQVQVTSVGRSAFCASTGDLDFSLLANRPERLVYRFGGRPRSAQRAGFMLGARPRQQGVHEIDCADMLSAK
eukprot:CAMPEP_0170386886 /NCGR_PEP_ID=MMETSP0117_2-20130122/17272_1 /TAXON_ID=400756 /ORGANISM="Durinskia baltica, Strain CSIRO CS-38" /LENGTH=393 /DNA_ID=CAMNT_0010642735 /DNA_START=61 /DNA_END=1240 /DNA_ORIENTATION=-